MKTLLMLPFRLVMLIGALALRYVVLAAVLALLAFGAFKYMDKQSMGAGVQPVIIAAEDVPSIDDAPWIALTRSRQYFVEQYTEDGLCLILERYWEKTQDGWILRTRPFRLDEAFGWYDLVPRGSDAQGP